MTRPKRGGRLTTSPAPPPLFSQRRKNSTETKYFGLVRDAALADLNSADKALDEVLRDIQDPAEAETLGRFVSTDLQIIDAVTSFDLKKEDFEILQGASISASVVDEESEGEESESAVLVPFISPRQRLSDRIKQFETFAGRGTVHQGQGTVLFKYTVSTDSQFNHTTPPPFYTQPLGPTSTPNAPDFIPQTPEEINSTHRVGFLQSGQFIPSQDPEWWWNGEYNHEFRGRAVYGREDLTALDDPKFPIVRDGNLKFSIIFPEGITTTYNWGLRFDTWFKKDDFADDQTFLRWVAQVNGHVRIDYFDRTGYNPSGQIQGSWKTALDTTNPTTYYSQLEKEQPTQSIIGCRQHYIQGGPSVTPLGSGTGTLPTQRSAAEGGAWDLNATFPGREGEERSKFVDEYIPVVIRFWYGKPNPEVSDPVLAAPAGPASLVLETIDSDIVSDDLAKWNDYSAEVKLIYDSAVGAWEAVAPEANFVNFTSSFEIMAHGLIDEDKPAARSDYIPTSPSSPVIATKLPPDGFSVTKVQFSIPGISPSANAQTLWVIAKNRPWIILPSGNIARTSLWQKYLFYPSPLGNYKTSNDLLDGVGANYIEPEPKFSSFESNPNYYKVKHGELPSLNTFGPARYDGLLPNTLREAVTENRDYDYQHEKLLLVGRQKKDETISPLAPGEVRNKAENYTFVEVVKNEAGRGGNVIINAYPTNNLSVLSTAVDDEQVGKFLHMGDNSKTFADPSRQNITTLTPAVLPSNTDFPNTTRIRYEEIDGKVGRLVYGTWDGTNFIPDTTGVIANLALGAPGDERSHLVKSAFLTDFKTVGGDGYSFYGIIGLLRDSKSSETIEVNSGGTQITSQSLFPNGGADTNDEQYIGTEIIFADAPLVSHYVTSYSPSAETVTISPSKPAGEYNGCQIWYNHFTMSGTLPNKIVTSAGVGTTRLPSILPANSFAQISFVFNTAYQFTRADNGAGLSFGETLYVKQSSSPTPSAPFVGDTELPAPPADIVVPFGYDNSATSGEPGLGGLCYPPYTIQNIQLQAALSVTDSTLYNAPAGQYDMWWGGRESPLDLGGKSLTITSKLLFDFAQSDRADLLSTLSTNAEKRTFSGSEYTHKLEVELSVSLPTPPAENSNIFNDAKTHSNNKPVKDRYYVFINDNNSQLEVLTPIDPNWQ
jgi:hypothetical protein